MIPDVRRRPSSVVRPDTGAEVVLVRGHDEVASWPLVRRGLPDVALVEELARLQLAARRLGCSIRLRRACPELARLIELVGLAEVLNSDVGTGGGLEVGGKAEGGEQRRVEEVVMPDDPVA